jgi:dTMP kinase
MKRGFFITFEGVDRCGKSTQAGKLLSYIKSKGYDVIFTREPGGTAISEKIRELLLDTKNKEMTKLTEILLYQASRAQHTDELIKPSLEQGKVVICDRYFDSTIAYQGEGRGIDKDDVITLNRIATSGICPDITIIIDLPPDEGIKRLIAKQMKIKYDIDKEQTVEEMSDRIERETIDFHNKVRNAYLSIAQQEPDRVKVVDGTGNIDDVWERVRKVIDKFISDFKIED